MNFLKAFWFRIQAFGSKFSPFCLNSAAVPCYRHIIHRACSSKNLHFIFTSVHSQTYMYTLPCREEIENLTHNRCQTYMYTLPYREEIENLTHNRDPNYNTLKNDFTVDEEDEETSAFRVESRVGAFHMCRVPFSPPRPCIALHFPQRVPSNPLLIPHPKPSEPAKP